MATIDLGRIKFKWQGAYNGATAYVVDDVVESGGSAYVCIAATTGNTPPNATYWELMSQKGVDADLINISGTVQGDIYYNNGSAIARLAPGTSGQYLETKGSGANPVWSTVSTGTYSIHAVDYYNYQVAVTSPSSNQEYIDISGGNYVSFQPTSTSDLIWIFHTCAINNQGTDYGCDVYMMMDTTTSIGSGSTKLNYDGNHALYSGSGGDYRIVTKQFILPCTALSTSTTYYLEQAGANHNTNPNKFNHASSNASGDYKAHNVTIIHYKA